VCPQSRASCATLDGTNTEGPLDLGRVPAGVAVSPSRDKLVVVSPEASSTPGEVSVVPVATPVPTPGSASLPPSPPASAPPASSPPGSEQPGSQPPAVEPIVIASGVTVVGEPAWSADGHWLAFSAAPSDGATGPDLYLYEAGTAAARPVTSDHATYFSSWYDGRILASRVVPVETPSATETASSSTEPAAPTSAAATDVEAHPSSFLLDPASLTVTDFAVPDVWLPVVDGTGRFAAYWSGTLVAAPDGGWDLGHGRLVLDGWSSALAPDESPSASDGSSAPSAPASPTVAAPTTQIPG
jgi:hypothetical protein